MRRSCLRGAAALLLTGSLAVLLTALPPTLASAQSIGTIGTAPVEGNCLVNGDPCPTTGSKCGTTCTNAGVSCGCNSRTDTCKCS